MALEVSQLLRGCEESRVGRGLSVVKCSVQASSNRSELRFVPDGNGGCLSWELEPPPVTALPMLSAVLWLLAHDGRTWVQSVDKFMDLERTLFAHLAESTAPKALPGMRKRRIEDRQTFRRHAHKFASVLGLDS